jgi:hypothetical protein
MNLSDGAGIAGGRVDVRTSQRFLLLLAVVVAMLFVSTAYAQLYTSNVVGTVTDQSGGVMPSAQVDLLNVNTGVKQTTQTNQTGDYVLQYLQPGTYTLTVSAKGFKQFVQENIIVQSLSKVSINVTLQPGAITQAVTVKAAPPLLETQTGEQSATLDTESVMDLPIDRSQLNMAGIGAILDSVKLLSPGVNMDSSGTWTVSEGGIYRRDQDYIDGAMVTQTVYEGNAIDPVPDAVQEIKVMTNSFSAVYGNTGGSITLESTRSGTNQFHGDVYEYLQNTKLNAGDPYVHTVTPEVYNQPGFSVGGPVKKDKLFFFADAEWERDQGNYAWDGVQVPDTAWTQGNFSNVLGTTPVGTDILGRSIYANEIFNYYTQRTLTAGQVDPLTGLTATAAGTVREPFAGNIIPFGATTVCAPNPTCTSAPALNLQKLYPSPTTNSVYANYFTSAVSYYHSHQWDLRMDYYARPQDKLMGRWSSWYSIGDTGSSTSPFPGLGGGGYAPGVEDSQSPVLDWVHTFGGNTINDVHAAYFHVWCYRVPVGYNQVSLNTYGIGGPPDTNTPNGVPTIYFSGTSGTNWLGSHWDTLELQGQADIYIDDLVSMVRGRHTFQVGGEFQRMQTNNLQPNPLEKFTFDNDFTDQYSGTGVGSTGFDYASFLTGLPSNFQFTIFPAVADVRASVFAAFAEDDFRLRPNLTLNLGLRWDAPLNWSGVNGTIGAVYQFNGTTTSLQQLGANGFRNTLWNNNYDNFGPRFGVAWSPHFLKDTVFRGGYGMFTMGVQEGGAQGGYQLSPFWKTSDLGRYNDSISASLTPGATLAAIPYSAATATLNANPSIYPAYNKSSTAQQWNVSVQREIPWRIVLNLAYAGSHSVHLPFGNFSYNDILPQNLATCENKRISPITGQACVPYPTFNIGALSNVLWLGSNIYHSFQFTATKRFSNGLSFLAGYTWAKNIDDGNYGYREPLTDRMLDRAPDSNTVPQRFTLASDYYLPFGPGRAFLTRGPLVPFLGGWQLGTIVTLQDGFPIYATTSSGCQCGGGASLPNQIGPAVPSGFSQNANHWFDVANFTPEALYGIGTEDYGTFLGPSLSNVNFSLSKRFYWPKFGENRSLQFRADFLNGFNTPWLSNPNTTIQSGAAGTITSVQNSPRVIQLALKLFF